jgi:hypothetical protein
MTPSRKTGHRFGLVLAACAAAIPLYAGNEGGWVNLPSWVSKDETVVVENVARDGRSYEGRGVGLFLTGAVADAAVRQLKSDPDVRMVTLPGGVRIEGRFTLSLTVDLMAGGSLGVDIGTDYFGGLGVAQGADLPPIPFMLTGNWIDLPASGFAELASAGVEEVALRFSPATLDRCTLLGFRVLSAASGSVEITSQIHAQD